MVVTIIRRGWGSQADAETSLNGSGGTVMRTWARGVAVSEHVRLGLCGGVLVRAAPAEGVGGLAAGERGKRVRHARAQHGAARSQQLLHVQPQHAVRPAAAGRRGLQREEAGGRDV